MLISVRDILKSIHKILIADQLRLVQGGRILLPTDSNPGEDNLMGTRHERFQQIDGKETHHLTQFEFE